MASDGKSVIVTGAGSGIGLAMALGLLEAGHRVLAVDRNPAGLDVLAARGKDLKGTVLPLIADLAEPDSFAHIAGTALIKFGCDTRPIGRVS